MLDRERTLTVKRRDPALKGLGGYASMALAHWKEHFPDMVKSLRKSGELAETLKEAEDQTARMMDETMASLEKSGYTPDQAYRTAWELIGPMYVLLDPEAQ